MSAGRDYRCYLLGSDNRIKDVVEFVAAGDDAAIGIATRRLAQLKHYAGIELWEGSRQVYVCLPQQTDRPEQ